VLHGHLHPATGAGRGHQRPAAYRRPRIPVARALREFPQLERSVIYVETVYPGANARTIQGFVTTPLQVNIAGARGVEYITSTSNPGVSSIEVHVRLGENTSDVLTEVIAKVNESRDELPEDVRDPVITTATGGDALIYIAFTSEQMTPYQVTDYLLRSVQPELATLDGVGKAAIYGRYLAMRVWLDPVRMAALGVTASDIAAAISRDNVISTAGATEGEWVRITVDAVTGVQTADDFRDLVVRQDADRQVRLGDVADVELAAENNQMRSFSSGHDTVFAAITPAPDANPLQVSRAVRQVLPDIEANLPADMTMYLDWDGSVAIDHALGEVTSTLVEAAAHRHPGHLPVSRLTAGGADPAAGDPPVPGGRGIPDSGHGFFPQPADPAGNGHRHRPGRG
jgi:multidrug efflux pump subunit AcrB